MSPFKKKLRSGSNFQSILEVLLPLSQPQHGSPTIMVQPLKPAPGEAAKHTFLTKTAIYIIISKFDGNSAI